MDEVSLWTGQLTHEQASGIYNTGATGNPEYIDLKSLSFSNALSGWWRFGASGIGTGSIGSQTGYTTVVRNLASRESSIVTGAQGMDGENISHLGLGLDLIITGNSGFYANYGQATGGIALSPQYPNPWSTYL